MWNLVQGDNALIDEVLSGNESAMELLVKRHYKTVFSYMYRSLGDYHASYDLTQEVFIKVLKSLRAFKKEKGEFSHWLLKIAVNTCKDFYKSSYYTRIGRNAVEMDENLYSEVNVTDFLEHREDTQTVKNAVSRLPRYQREAIVLRFFHDMKITDISKLTEANEATVKSRIGQGLKKLKKILLEGEMRHEKREIR